VVPEISGELNHLQHSVNSLFFEVQGRLRLDQTVVQERSVVQREGLNVKTLWRDRGGQAPPITALQ
jgi:general secretion pathway protein K